VLDNNISSEATNERTTYYYCSVCAEIDHNNQDIDNYKFKIGLENIKFIEDLITHREMKLVKDHYY
jgi:hypothetical protein